MIATTIHLLFYVYSLILLARILGSWFPQWHRTKLFRFICYYADPYLNLFRRFIPPIGMLDISPIVALIALQVAEKLIAYLLFRIL